MKGAVLVVGAGPAGMRASYELVNQGFKVVLVEEKPTIGGKMAQIDKMFPTNECSTCTILPKMLELTSNPNVTIVSFADVESIEGEPGDFKVKVTKKPRYVDPAKCTACTDCFGVCPVGGIPMEFNFGRSTCKAISFYSPFPPRKALINPDKCNYLIKGKCGDKEIPPCVEACKPQAIAFEQKAQTVEFNVGAVILATGIKEVKTGLLEKHGYSKFPDVLTGLEYERLLSGLGPTSGVVKRDDGQEPRSVCWYVLDNKSPIGFMTAVAQSLGTIERKPDATVTVLHENHAPQRESYKDFYQKASQSNINFIQTDDITSVKETGGKLEISFDNETITAEMFVLIPPLDLTESGRKLAEKTGLELNESGFIEGKSTGSHPIRTSREGIFVCGSASGLKGIDDAVIQACAAASDAASFLAAERGSEIAPPLPKELLDVKPQDEPVILVVICQCGKNIAGLLDMQELVEYSKSLPNVRQVEVTPFGCDGVKIRGLLKSGDFNRLVLGACSPKTHEDLFSLHAEMGGLNRYLMEIVNLRNHCTWVHSRDREKATDKAKTLMRMGVKRAGLLESLDEIHVPVTPACLVIGGEPGGISCALKLAEANLDVYLVDARNKLDKIEKNDAPIVKNLIEELSRHEKVKVYTGSQVAGAEGFVGNFKAEIVTTDGKEDIDIGSIVVATKTKIGTDSDEGDFEKDLLLQRDENDFFIGMLGILNPLDFNTEGVFRCGSAREEMEVLDAIIDGQAVASRVAGIISKKELVKSPATSFVVDEFCDGCAYCIDPCPSNAISLIEYMTADGSIKKTVEVNEAVCRGCGVCMATCPKKGIFVRHFKREYFEEMIKAVVGV
jgi:heterodisulfide reductase subunit A